MKNKITPIKPIIDAKFVKSKYGQYTNIKNILLKIIKYIMELYDLFTDNVTPVKIKYNTERITEFIFSSLLLLLLF